VRLAAGSGLFVHDVALGGLVEFLVDRGEHFGSLLGIGLREVDEILDRVLKVGFDVQIVEMTLLALLERFDGTFTLRHERLLIK